MKKQIWKLIAFAALMLTGLTPAHAQGTQGPAANGTAAKGYPLWLAGTDVSSILRSILTDSTGKILIGNFPSSQAVTGTFWQATQPVSISGSVPVTGTFWQTTQPVSLLSLPALPTGSNAIGSVTVSNLPATQPVSGTVGVSSLPALPAGANAIGSVSVSNLPATQAVTQSGAWTNTVTQPTGSNLHVQVDSAPTTTITGSVGVSSLPALPAGSNAIGSVSVSNFPATQPISGNVGITGTPAVSISGTPTVSISGTVTTTSTSSSAGTPGGSVPMTAILQGGSDGTALRAIKTDASGNLNVNVLGTVPVSGSISATNPSVATSGGTQPTSATLIGGANGGNLQPISVDSSGRPNVNINGTVPISATSLPLPTGAALDATLTGGTAQTRITNGTNTADVINPQSGQNSLLVAPSFKEVTFTTTTAQTLAFTEVRNYNNVSVQITSQGTSSIVTFQGSNQSGGPWVNIPLTSVTNTGNAAPSSTSATTGIFTACINFRYFQVVVGSISAGTTAGVIEFSASSYYQVPPIAVVSQSGTWTVQQGTTSAGNSPWTVTEAATAGGWTANNISTNTTTTVKSGAGRLRTITINNPGSAETVTVYDNTTATGTKLATLGGLTGPITMTYDAQFATGLTVVTAGTTAADVTISYK